MTSGTHENSSPNDNTDAAILSELEVSSKFDDFEDTFGGLESLRAALYDNLIELETHGIKPDLEMVEATNIPFGNTGQAMLSGDLQRGGDGTLRGWLRIADPTGEQNLPKITRDPIFNRWFGPDDDGKQLRHTDEGIVRKLDRSWPWNTYDNTFIRNASMKAAGDSQFASPEHDSGSDIHTVFRDELSAHAEQYHVVREYKITVELDEAGTIIPPVTTKLNVSKHNFSDGGDGMTIALEHTIQIDSNGTQTPLTIAVEIDETGNISLDSHYKHPDTGEPIPLPVDDEFSLIAELVGVLNRLVSEKLTLQSRD